MYVIKRDLTSQIEVKKSKFITYIFQVDSKNAVKEKLNFIKQEHLQAKHILYCYLLKDNSMEASENKEPISSMHKCLDLLTKKDLKNILCIVVRYFGGIELGASNLDRTYINCIFNLLTDDNIQQEVVYYEYYIKFKNSYYALIKKRLEVANAKILEREFNLDLVNIKLKISHLPDNILPYLIQVKKIL